MKARKIILLLIIAIFLIGCSEKNEKIQLIETNAESSTIYQNDNIKIKIADNIDEKETIYTSILNEIQKIGEFSPIENLEVQISKQYLVPNIDKIIKCDTKFIETEEFKKELIKKSYGIYDNWISEGLYAKLFDTEKSEVDFAKYYANRNFSLFGARFFESFVTKEEVENVKAASIDLVKYLLENNKKEEIIKNNINISDIKEWAKEKNIDLSYQNEIQSLMNRMEAYRVADKFIINTREEVNGFKIDISIAEIEAGDEITEQYDTAEKIEKIILRFDRDIEAIKRGIEKDAPKFYTEYKEVLNNVPKVEYIFYTNANQIADGGYVLQGDGKINLRDMIVQAHEYCHFLFHSAFTENDIAINKPSWIDEGIANYLDAAYSEAYAELVEDSITYIVNFEISELASEELTENERREIKKLRTEEVKIFIENDIDINNINEVVKYKNKKVLENHLRVLSKVKFNQILDSKSNDGSAPLDLMTEGDSMDYHKNFSFFNYLVEEYGLGKMLYLNVADFNGLTYKEVFGKTFNELRVDWMNYLKENIKGIESIL
ncbi:hypothetical protein NE686_05970 [Tissierella carlieri]|uniref:Uncharacterized protein n=1 Tax=Tissierella carlieri TaxID=689904 RepID=A0ABT1S8F2_9FIRM|nr:hypothetical protein [Tissierella carlieri]MCQ4922620.1 hypothetical protein [Tissierella carlieri]